MDSLIALTHYAVIEVLRALHSDQFTAKLRMTFTSICKEYVILVVM